MSRARLYCFTLHVTEDEEAEYPALWQALVTNGTARYVVFQLEAGSESGRRHYQGCVWWSNAKTKRATKRALSSTTVHVEKCKGSVEENKRYCTKEQTRVGGPWEHGEPPKQGARTDLSEVLTALASGETTVASEIEAGNASVARSLNACRFAQGIAEAKRFDGAAPEKPEVVWWTGQPGTGKSTAAREWLTQAYWKDDGSRWWDGYNGEEDIVIDEVRPDSVPPLSMLLKILDGRPTRVEVKGGTTTVLARRVAFTSNYVPGEVFTDDNSIRAINRRLSKVITKTQVMDPAPEPEYIVE